MSGRGRQRLSAASVAIRRVRRVIGSAAARERCSVTQDAEDFLVEDGPDYLAANPNALPLDVASLDKQVDELFETVARDVGPLRGKTLDRRDFARAKPNVICHYIWFC